MKKVKISIEHELNSNSESIIWSLISTDGGLSKWLADNVIQEGNALSFTWGEEWSHHEKRKADIIDIVKNDRIKFKWTDDDDDDYWEIKMKKNELTNDYLLVITDFATEDEVESLKEIWDDNFEQLRQSTGM
jgi:uncharacterized protein YndB with AHSA1/START domain